MVAKWTGGIFLNKTERFTGCDYFGNRSFVCLSPDFRELTPDDAFLRIFPFCRGQTPLPFSFWLAGITCRPNERQLIADAWEMVCTAPEDSLFSTAPLIIVSEDGGGAASRIYGLVFHAGGAEMCSPCVSLFSICQRELVLCPDDGSGAGKCHWEYSQ